MASRFLLLIALALTACSPVPADLFTRLPPPGAAHVEMQYLGSGGWLITKGTHKIATAPFVTNPNGLTLLFPRSPDERLIDEVIPSMHDVGIILVGHGHYDHAMDLPAIHARKAPKATIYGSATVVNTLGAVAALDGHLVAITDGDLAHGDRPGRWLPSATSDVRFMALKSTHAPHIDGLKILPSSSVEQKQAKLPCCPFWWKEGPTYAYLIDFLENGKIAFRIYYQDAAAERGTGRAPVFAAPDAAPVDVAIVCVASFDRVDDHPGDILGTLQPRSVIGGHWEDFFFRAYKAPPRAVPFTNLEEFHRRATARVPGRPIYLPNPGDKVYIPVVKTP